jgi:hypothetical protein
MSTKGRVAALLEEFMASYWTSESGGGIALGVIVAIGMIFGVAGSDAPGQEPGAKPQATQDLSQTGKNAMRVGINASGLAWWDSNRAFTEAMTGANRWRDPADTGRQSSVEQDKFGNPQLKPGQRAQALAFSFGSPAGVYTLTWKGTGKMDVFGGKLRTVKPVGEAVSTGGRGEYEVMAVDESRGKRINPVDIGVSVRIIESDPADPVRDVRLWLPGYGPKPGDADPKIAIRPEFIDSLKPFGVMRYMGMMETNNSRIATWDDRPTTAYTRWQGLGVPLELLIELANRADHDPWFCMPHLADDDYVRKFAEQVKRDLDPKRKIYVEYSNEVANHTFAVCTYAADKGRELGLATDAEVAGMKKWEQPLLFRHRFHALRTQQIAEIWRDVFDDQEGRVIVVLASNAPQLKVAMAYPGTADAVDAVSTCSYWGHAITPKLPKPIAEKLTEEVMLDHLERDLLDRVGEHARDVAAIARQYGKPLVLYEGGQHLSSYGGKQEGLSEADVKRLHEVSLAVQDNPRMGELMRKDFEMWQGLGAELYAAFVHVSRNNGDHSFGILDAADDTYDATVKGRAILDFIGAGPDAGRVERYRAFRAGPSQAKQP